MKCALAVFAEPYGPKIFSVSRNVIRNVQSG